MISRWQPLAITVITVLCLNQYTFAAPAGNGIGEVVWVKGQVQAVSADNQSRPLKRKDVIYEHDVLNTSAGSEGQVVFTDGGLLALREKSSFKINEYHFNKSGDPSQNKYVANLVKGGFRTITGAISKGHPENYTVSTPVATIGVRGTGYSAYCDEKSQCAFKLDMGSIIVTNKNGELVLTEDKRYGEVPSINARPVLTTGPAGVFRGEPQLVPASTSGGIGTPGNTSGGATGGPSKTVSGFCISVAKLLIKTFFI